MDVRRTDPPSPGPSAEMQEFDRLWRSLRDDLRRHGADFQTAEDIAQETWLIALRRPPEERGRFRGWLRVVAVRLLRRSQHRERGRASKETKHVRDVLEVRSDDASSGGASASLLRRFVDESPEPYRTALTLRYFEGLEVAEIAQRLSMSKTLVHTHLKRGIQRLRSRVVSPERTRGERRNTLLGWLGLSGGLGSGGRSRSARPLAAGGLLLASLSTWLLWSAKGSAHPDSSLARDVAPLTSDPRPASWPGTLPPEPLRRDELPVAPGRARQEPLTGLVLTPAGDPLPGARVHVGDRDGSEQVTTLSDSEGRYELMPHGDYIWATHPAWCESPRTLLSTVLEPQHLDLTLSPTRGTVRIYVRDHAGEPVAGAQVRQDASWTNPQVITPQGRLELDPPLPPGLTDEKGWASMLFLERPTSELFVVARDLPGRRLTVSTPAAGSILEIGLPPPATLEGICRGADGQPSWNATIEVLQLSGLVTRPATTDASGVFRVTGLAPGEYLLRAVEAEPGFASALFAGWLEAGDPQPITVELREGNSILGLVVDESGPVAGARVELEVFNLLASESSRRILHTDASGRFRFPACSQRATLQVFQPGATEPSVGEEKLPPEVGERVYRVPRRETPRAPIELAFLGSRRPLLVELRRRSPVWSVTLVPEEGDPGRFRSPPLPEGDYGVYAWDADYAVWKAQDLHHDPQHPEEHTVVAPEPGRLLVSLRLPEGVRREEVEVALLVPSFHHYGRVSSGLDQARRLVPWSESEQAFAAWVPPGHHSVIVRGTGLAELQLDASVLSGAEVRLAAAPRAGIESTIFFESLLDPPEPGRSRSRSLLPTEEIRLEVLARSGRETILLLARNLRRVEGGFEFLVGLPPDTLELEARTQVTRGGAYVPREGRCVLEPGRLEAATGRPRIRIPLVNVP